MSEAQPNPAPKEPADPKQQMSEVVKAAPSKSPPAPPGTVQPNPPPDVKQPGERNISLFINDKLMGHYKVPAEVDVPVVWEAFKRDHGFIQDREIGWPRDFQNDLKNYHGCTQVTKGDVEVKLAM